LGGVCSERLGGCPFGVCINLKPWGKNEPLRLNLWKTCFNLWKTPVSLGKSRGICGKSPLFALRRREKMGKTPPRLGKTTRALGKTAFGCGWGGGLQTRGGLALVVRAGGWARYPPGHGGDGQRRPFQRGASLGCSLMGPRGGAQALRAEGLWPRPVEGRAVRTRFLRLG